MHGGAITLADRILDRRADFDLILATDMLDLNVFLSLVRRRCASTPTALYFHESQLSYPWSPTDRDPALARDRHYAFINYASALAADRILFNSDFHRLSFLEALPPFLSAYPDFENKGTIAAIAAKSETLPLGIDLAALNRCRPATRSAKTRPLLLWNHRWEYDKDPEAFFALLFGLIERGTEFDVALLGERFRQEPAYFAAARSRLGARIVAYGRAESFAEYGHWLWRADIAPVTARQDFFGGSTVEAIHCGCWPLLPARLAYPEHIDIEAHPECYYSSLEEGIDKLDALIRSEAWREPCPLAKAVARYDWATCGPLYDRRLAAAANSARPQSC